MDSSELSGRWSWSCLYVVVALLSSGAGCRIGGPGATGSTGDGGVRDVRGDGTVLVRGSSMLDGAVAVVVPDTMGVLGATDAGAGTGGGPEAGGGPGSDAADGTGGATAGGDAGTVDGVIPTATGCAPPKESKVCDPVCDTGCPALSRCDVTDKARTGRCIGIWISGEGTLCLKTDITDPCAAHLTCVDGACRRLCYRDSDCASPGSCCGQDLLLDGDASGYKICVPCAR